MAASNYFESIQSLYVAYFSRPADAAGLAYWADVAAGAGGDTSAVSASFAGSSEYMGLYAGLTSYQIVNTIYQNLFGRGAEPDALKFWGAALDSGAMTIDDAVTQIAGAAQGSDGTAFGNKVKGAVAFTYALDRTSEILGYTGDAANGAARSWLGGITDDGSLERALAPDALAGVVAFVTGLGQAEAGAKLALTTGIDTLAGGAGNDTFTAVYDGTGQGNGTTLTALDVLDGGAGYDTLQINALKDLTALPPVSVSNIEKVVIRAAQGVTADIRAWSGVEQLTLSELHGAASLAAGTATGVSVAVSGPDTGAVRVAGGGDVSVKTSNVTASNAIAIDGAAGAVTVETTGRAAVNGGQLTMGGIDVTGGTTIRITQQAATDTSALTGTKAVHAQGAIRVTGGAATTSVSIKQDAASAGQDGVATVAAVTETATVKFVAMPAGATYTIGGLVFHATAVLSGAEVAQAFSNLVQGSVPAVGDTQGPSPVSKGYFTGLISGWTSGAAVGDTVVFTSTGSGNVDNLEVKAANGATALTPVVVDGVAAAGKAAQMQVVAGRVTIEDTHASIKDVRIDAYGGASSLVATSALERLELANSSASLTVDRSAATLSLQLEKIGTKTADRASLTLATSPTTLNVESVGDNFVSLSAAGTESLHVSGTGTFHAEVVDMASLELVTVAGDAGLDTGAAVLAATSIGAAATRGNVTVTIDAGATRYAGGSGVDTVTLAPSQLQAAPSRTITLGAGDDMLDAEALDAGTLASMRALWTGGEGSDTLKLSSLAAQVLSATSAFEGRIEGFEKLEIGVLAGTTTINLDNLDDINHVIVNGGMSEPVIAAPIITQGALAKKLIMDFFIVDLASGDSFMIGGRTITAVGGVATAQDVATALLTGTTTGNADVSGTLDNWTVTRESGNVVRYTANYILMGMHMSPNAPDFSAVQERVLRVTETAVVTFPDMTFGQGFTLAGVTLKAIGPVSAREVADYFITGSRHPNLEVTGTLDTANWTISDNGGASLVDARFTSKVDGDVTDLAFTGVTGGEPAVVTFEQMASGATLELNRDNRVVVQLKDASGAADVLDVVVASSSTSSVTAHGVETINVSARATHELTLAADAATTIVVSGHASSGTNAGVQAIVLDASSTAVTLIDGSGATSDLVVNLANAATAQAVTIKGGAGRDVLAASLNHADVLEGGDGNDALFAGKGMASLTGGAGYDLFVVDQAANNVNSYATITDFGKDDLLRMGGMTAFHTTKVELGETAVFQDYANAVVNLLGAGHGGWFEFGGNTYVVLDAGVDSTNGFVDGQDFIVKLTGSIDLSQVSFNQSFASIALV